MYCYIKHFNAITGYANAIQHTSAALKMTMFAIFRESTLAMDR